MFVKLFAQILDSSIADNRKLRHFFTDLLLCADASGNVMMTDSAISRRIGADMQEVEWGLRELSSPDPRSKTPDHEGRRIERIEDHGYGWRILNYELYRSLRDAEQLREATRIRVQRCRDKKKGGNGCNAMQKENAEGEENTEEDSDSVSNDKQSVSASNQESSQSAQGEEEEYGEGKEEVDAKRSKKKTFSIEFPDDLPSEYVEPLTEWWNYKREKGDKYTKSGWLKLVGNQRSFMAMEVKASVNKSMSNNWKGLFTDKITAEDIDFVTPKPQPRSDEPDIDFMALMFENRAKAAAKEAELAEAPPSTEDSTWS